MWLHSSHVGQRLVRQLAILRSLHQQRLVHGAIKSSSILLVDLQGSGEHCSFADPQRHTPTAADRKCWHAPSPGPTSPPAFSPASRPRSRRSVATAGRRQLAVVHGSQHPEHCGVVATSALPSSFACWGAGKPAQFPAQALEKWQRGAGAYLGGRQLILGDGGCVAGEGCWAGCRKQQNEENESAAVHHVAGACLPGCQKASGDE